MKRIIANKHLIVLSSLILLIAFYFVINKRKDSEIVNVTSTHIAQSIDTYNKTYEGFVGNSKYVVKLKTDGLKVDGEFINIDSNVKTKIYGWLDTNRKDQYFYELNNNNRLLSYLSLVDSLNYLIFQSYTGSDGYEKQIVLSNVVNSVDSNSTSKCREVFVTKENIEGIYRIHGGKYGESPVKEILIDLIPPNRIRFKIVLFSPPACEGELDATGILTDENTVIFSEDECKLRLIFEWNGKEFNRLLVDEADRCGYHGMTCYFNGVYKKVNK